LTPKQFQKYLDRDGGCVHCGETEAVAPNHRANRGMGGSKKRDVPSNIVVLCSYLNGMIESNSSQAHHARMAGWKLFSHEDATSTPLWDAQTSEWVLLADDFSRAPVEGREPFVMFF